jgi:hypothetical protein
MKVEGSRRGVQKKREKKRSMQIYFVRKDSLHNESMSRKR